MSSVDFKAYVQAELDDIERRTNLYQGKASDLGASAEHLTVEHLEALLSGELSPELRSLYMGEYSDIRAALRAVAMCGLTRKDFYDVACHEALRERDFLKTELGTHTTAATQFLRRLPEELQESLTALEAEHEARKNAIMDRLRAEGGTPSAETLRDADVVRQAMKDVVGVSPRGVSTSVKRVS